VEHHEFICLGNAQRGREVVSMVVCHDGYFQHFLLLFFSVLYFRLAARYF
jgi:hypothetical protein